MNDGQASFWMIALFALRCIVPIVVTLFIGYMMNKLVDKWEAEDQLTANKVVPSVGAMPMKKPSAQWCWQVRGCDHSECVVYQNTQQVCWQMKAGKDGRLAPACQQCDYFVQSVMA